jgi:hypothetical protein
MPADKHDRVLPELYVRVIIRYEAVTRKNSSENGPVPSRNGAAC